MNLKNFFLPSKRSRLVKGHIDAKNLEQMIMNHEGTEAYCCYFDLDENLLKIEYDTGEIDSDGKKIYQYVLRGQKPKAPHYKCNGPSFAKYEGFASPALNMVSFDFDSEDVEESLKDVKNFVEWVDEDEVIVFFSGAKGFHVMIPFEFLPLEAGEHLPNQLKDLAKHLKKTFPTLDDSIYNYQRKFRVPFTKHDKSGLYKVLIDSWLIEDILEKAKTRHVEAFLPPIEKKREPLDIFVEAVVESERASYEIEKDRAGSLEKPSPFEAYDGKLCIKKMLESRCDGNRNNAALRIVNDFYRTGKPRQKCVEVLKLWSENNGLAWSEIQIMIQNIYDHGHNYNYGCQDELKAEFCSAKCAIWKKLDPEKRPVTVDQPASSGSSSISVFEGVAWLFQTMFNVGYNEETKEFDFSHTLILKQNGTELFYYKEGHWQHIDKAKEQKVKTLLNNAHQKKLGLRKLEEVYKMFVMYAPEVPEEVDLFRPRRDVANFKDGTLHLKRVKGEFVLEFKDHDKFDYCTTLIDLNYQDYQRNPEATNKKFEAWLLEFLENDKEAYGLIQEMFGASLMPRFPQFFVLIGLSGTGKSTTIKILKQLHKNDKNISGVSPDAFHGFNMSSMIGKLLNIVGDIKTNCSIDDDIVKQVDDQEPVRISIKGKDDVYTTLPALHIFGANKMPKTSEGYSGAMKRRFSIINFDKKFTGKKNPEIAKDLFSHNPQGVLNFALKGLERLVLKNGGEYTNTAKKEINVENWTKQNDPFWAFLKDLQVEHIDVDGRSYKIQIQSHLEVKSNDLWRVYKKWQRDAVAQNELIGKIKFFKLVEENGFLKSRNREGIVFKGIGFEGDELEALI